MQNTAKPAQPQDGPAFHPLAEMFPLMQGAAFDDLVADIRANGLIEPIILHEDKILDGRNRERACRAAGVEPTYRPFMGDDPLAYVISANLHRRHLTPEQKLKIVEDLIRAKPEASSRQIADMAKVSPTTASKIRHEMEDVSSVDTSIDTRGRRQPRTKTKTLAQIEERQLDSICRNADFSTPVETVAATGDKTQHTRQPAIKITPPSSSKRQPVTATGLNSIAFVDAPPAERTRFLDAIGPKAVLAALPINWTDAVRAWLAIHDARPGRAAPASNSDDDLEIPPELRRLN